MAVSKTQNERPAITDLIDAVNMAEPIVAQNVQNIATLTEGLADEISDREAADTLLEETIESETTARQQAVANIQNQIGEGLFSSSFTITQGYQQAANTLVTMNRDIATLQNWQNRFRLGLTPNIMVEMGDSTSDTLSFATPFEQDAEVAVFLVCVDGSEILTDLSCKLISATYSGFSFAVFNDTQADVTIKVGFLAVRMN